MAASASSSSTSISRKRGFEVSLNSAFSSYKRQKGQSKWVVNLEEKIWDRIFTFVKNPGSSMLHPEFLSLAGTCSLLRNQIAKIVIQDVREMLQPYINRFFSCIQYIPEDSPVHAQAKEANELVRALLEKHGLLLGHPNFARQQCKVMPFRILSKKEIDSYSTEMMKIWKLERKERAQQQLDFFSLEEVSPSRLSHLDVLLHLFDDHYPSTVLSCEKLTAIVSKNPKAFDLMHNAGRLNDASIREKVLEAVRKAQKVKDLATSSSSSSSSSSAAQSTP